MFKNKIIIPVVIVSLIIITLSIFLGMVNMFVRAVSNPITGTIILTDYGFADGTERTIDYNYSTNRYFAIINVSTFSLPGTSCDVHGILCYKVTGQYGDFGGQTLKINMSVSLDNVVGETKYASWTSTVDTFSSLSGCLNIMRNNVPSGIHALQQWVNVSITASKSVYVYKPWYGVVSFSCT